MPVEPWIFLSYGRPDRKLAHAISSLLWSEHIETYNYLQDSVIVREFGLKDATYLTMLAIAKLWVVILTSAGIKSESSLMPRETFLDELRWMRDGMIRDRKTPTVVLSNNRILEEWGFLKPSHVVNLSDCDSPRTIRNKLIELIPAELIERSRKSWEVNQQLSEPAWRELDRDMQIKDDTSSLPPALDLLKEVTNGANVDEFLSSEIRTLNAEVHRWLVTVKLSQCLSTVSADVSRALLRASRDLREKDPHLLAETVAEKEYGPNEVIQSASQVVRGLFRVRDKLETLDYKTAYDIVGRIAWPRTRQVLLCAVYSISRTMAEAEICHAIVEDVGAQRNRPISDGLQ